MREEELITNMLARFDQGFAQSMAARVLQSRAVETLYGLATARFDKWGLTVKQTDAVVFRAAYVLEYIYFNHRELFVPFEDRFVADFESVKNPSARRHFAKIMADFLDRGNKITPQSANSVAQSAALWAVEQSSRVAVKIWAVGVLIALRGRVEWVDDVLYDIFETLARDSSPAVECRLRNWRDKVK